MGRYKEVHSIFVSKEFFETLGVQPLRGSGFSREENRDGAVISYRYWRDEMMSAENAVGMTVMIDEQPFRIVGIMPEKFKFPIDTDVWRCIEMWWPPNDAIQLVGRLRSGVPLKQAAKDLKAIDFTNIRNVFKSSGPVLQPLQTFLYNDHSSMLWMFGVTAGMFLALMCVGAVNLLVMQGSQRKPEFAIRMVMGASRKELVCMLLMETLPLVIAGGLLGWGLSEFADVWLRKQFVVLQDVNPVIPVKMSFCAALVMIATIIGGLIPALYVNNLDLNTYLKNDFSDKRRLFSSQELLIGVQLSLTLALLIGVGVLLRSLMLRVDFPIGWSPEKVVVVSTGFSTGNNSWEKDTLLRYARFTDDARHELKTIPGVAAIGMLSPVPLSREAVVIGNMVKFISGVSTIPSEIREHTGTPILLKYPILVKPDGFNVLGIRLIAGRDFTEADSANMLKLALWDLDNPPMERSVGYVAIINQSMAKQLWPKEKPENTIGKVFYDVLNNSHEVVGVVRNYHQIPGNNSFIPILYAASPGTDPKQQFLIRLRSGVSLENFRLEAHRRLYNLEQGLSKLEVRPLSEVVSEVTRSQYLAVKLIGCFAFLGMIVSGLGVYATATFMAVSRYHEIGIRIAMGAQTKDILLFSLWHGARAILIGLPSGLFLAMILSKILSTVMFQVNIVDPFVWIISCVLLACITFIAALFPALQAIRVNPLDVIRSK